jgi:hypothetical protein
MWRSRVKETFLAILWANHAWSTQCLAAYVARGKFHRQPPVTFSSKCGRMPRADNGKQTGARRKYSTQRIFCQWAPISSICRSWPSVEIKGEEFKVPRAPRHEAGEMPPRDIGRCGGRVPAYFIDILRDAFVRLIGLSGNFS